MVNPLPLTNRCFACGEDYHVVHVCPTTAYKPKPPSRAGCQPLRQLTEADVRRIVREELALINK